MFPKMRVVSSGLRLCAQTLCGLCFLLPVFTSMNGVWKAEASNDKTKVENFQTDSAEIKLDGLHIIKTPYFTKISWQTRFESGVLGFNVWRETSGRRELVNNDLIAGSAAKVGNALLPVGDRYDFFDDLGDAETLYYLETVFLTGEKHWFGPYQTPESFQKESAEDLRMFFNQKTPQTQIERADLGQFENFLGDENVSSAELVGQSDLAADGNALKLEVRQTGWYRIEASVLQQNGFVVSASATWKLYTSGREVPIIVTADGSVEFYGAGLETWQTDSRTYWLTFNDGNGKRLTRATQKFNRSTADATTRLIVERRDRNLRISSVLNGSRENWFTAYIGSTDTNLTLNLSEISSVSTDTATIGVDLQGIGSSNHQVTVWLNGSQIGQIGFLNIQRQEWTTNVPVSLLRAGANEIKLRSSGASDYSLLEAVRINYPRRLRAENNRLQFTVPARKAVKLRGFTNSKVRVFDVTTPEKPTEIAPVSRLETDGTYSVTLASVSTTRAYLAQGESATPAAVAGVVKNIPSNWQNLQNQADFIVIAPAQFTADLQTFKNVRISQGLRTVIVDPADIYDEFNFGMRSSEAVRAFLQFAKQNWSVKPNFVLLVGDASVDPRNFSGLGGAQTDLVPTILVDTWNMEAPSDVLMADFNGDNVEDLTLGRLPVRTNAELAVVLGKIFAHESFSNEQILQRGVLMVSDSYLGYDFETGSRNMTQVMPTATNLAFTDVALNDPATVRQNVLTGMSGGPAVVNYFGHGSTLFWTGHQIYRSADAPTLTNYSQPSLAVMLACLNGAFAETSIESLSEATLKAPQGGAFAVWASSGWNGAYDQEIMGREFYQRAFAGMPLGEAARQAKSLFPSQDLRRTYFFFGDPTQKLIRF